MSDEDDASDSFDRIESELRDEFFFECDMCGGKSIDVSERDDPYQADVHDVFVKRYLCDFCYNELVSDI